MPVIHTEKTEMLVPFRLTDYEISRTIKISRDDFQREVDLLPDSCIIIAPAYDEVGQPFQFQMCLTGKVKKDETIEQGLKREIAEEIGLLIDTSSIKTRKRYLEFKKERDLVTYFSTVELKPENLLSGELIPSVEEDDFKKKLCCLMYVKLENWESFKEILYHRHRIDSSDIAGEKIICFTKSELQTIIHKWKTNSFTKTDKYHFKIE